MILGLRTVEEEDDTNLVVLGLRAIEEEDKYFDDFFTYSSRFRYVNVFPHVWLYL